MVMIAVDNFFKTIWHHRAYYLTPPFFVCVWKIIYIFFLSSSPAEKATLHFSLTMYKSKGRQKKLPPTYTHRKKKKKPQPPHMLFCLDFSHGSGLQILWTIKHHITNKSKAYTHTHTPLFSLSSSKEKKNMGKKGK